MSHPTVPELPAEPSSADPAFISAEDVERAKQAWQRDAPPEFQNLLDAEREGAPNA